MRNISRKYLKIITATSMTIFSLFAAGTGVFAWFASKFNEASSGTNFGVINNDSAITTLSCYAIKYDGVYGASAIKATSGEQDIKMSEYDYIFRDKNINTSLFFTIEITGFDTNKDLQIVIPAFWRIWLQCFV